MNGQYDKELKEIDFYKTHPEYLPFIGDLHDEFKILQVGESHYIPQEKGNEDLFSIAYFMVHIDPCSADHVEVLCGHLDPIISVVTPEEAVELILQL